MADVKNVYPASTTLTVTNLASLASSSTWIAGWESSTYDNSSNLYPDVRVAMLVKVGTTPTTNTQIIVWVAAENGDGVWPDVLDGTESAETWTNAEMRDAGCRLGAVCNIVSTTSNLVYPIDIGSVAALFGGIMPKKFVLFLAHNTGANLNASGHVANVHPLYQTVT